MACAERTVFDAVAARLADIRTSNAYETDLGARVYDEEPEPEDSPVAPFLVMGGFSSALLIAEAADYIAQMDLDVYIDISARCYKDARAEALDCLRDIERVLRANADWASTVMQIRLVTKLVPRRTRGSNYLVATAAIEIDYIDED